VRLWALWRDELSTDSLNAGDCRAARGSAVVRQTESIWGRKTAIAGAATIASAATTGDIYLAHTPAKLAGTSKRRR
jgi:hypothetical protein